MKKWIWKLFYLLVAVIFFHSFGLLFGIHFSENIYFHSVLLLLPILLFFLHAIYTLGIKRSLFFILLASGTGWFMETVGLRYGTVFGGRYVYEGNQIMIGMVPLSVVLYWAAFIYTGYSIINSFLYWLHKKKPTAPHAPVYHMLPLILGDGIAVTIIDMFMDPIQVKSGAWSWLDGGEYFGIPIGNFVGWFLTTIIVTGIFRLTEYVSGVKEDKKDTSILVLPAVAYGMLAISFTISAVQFKLDTLAIIGLSLMAPIVIVNIYLYIKFMKGGVFYVKTK